MIGITLTHEEGIKLLKEGNSLTAHMSDLSTLSINKGQITWVGVSDQGATYLEENETKSLFEKNTWHINIF